MNDSPLRIPQAGDRVSATQLARVVRAVNANRLLPSPGFRISRGPNGTHLIVEAPKGKSSAARPLPYEVRFDGSLNDGDGGWKIYLPTAHLVCVDGNYTETADIGGITAIEDVSGNPTGWYSLDDIELSADHVWLTIEVDDVAFASEQSEEDDAISVCIAEVEYEAGSGEGSAATIKVMQSVVGALILTKDDEFPPPFTVRWAASEGQDGAWVVWLPYTASDSMPYLVMIGGAYYTPSSYLTAAANLPRGWYLTPNGAADGSLWLNVTVPQTDSGTPTCALSDQQGSGGLGVHYYSVKIAAFATAANGAKRVWQFVDSFVKFPWNSPSHDGGGGGGFDPDTEFLHPFEVRYYSGEYIIWLPNPAKLLMYGNSYATIQGVTAHATLPSGWYTMDSVSAQAQGVYLVVNITDSSGIVSATLDDQEANAQTGHTIYNILIATTSGSSVRQYVDSAVFLGKNPPKGQRTFVESVGWSPQSHPHCIVAVKKTVDMATGDYITPAPSPDIIQTTAHSTVVGEGE